MCKCHLFFFLNKTLWIDERFRTTLNVKGNATSHGISTKEPKDEVPSKWKMLQVYSTSKIFNISRYYQAYLSKAENVKKKKKFYLGKEYNTKLKI